MAIDYETPSGQVRLTIIDTNETDFVFSDAQITAFLTMAGDNVDRAAARALDVIASDEALTSKVIRSQDLATDGPKTAAALREHAKQLREQADDESEGFFEIIAFDSYPELES